MIYVQCTHYLLIVFCSLLSRAGVVRVINELKIFKLQTNGYEGVDLRSSRAAEDLQNRLTCGFVKGPILRSRPISARKALYESDSRLSHLVGSCPSRVVRGLN